MSKEFTRKSGNSFVCLTFHFLIPCYIENEMKVSQVVLKEDKDEDEEAATAWNDYTLFKKKNFITISA